MIAVQLRIFMSELIVYGLNFTPAKATNKSNFIKNNGICGMKYFNAIAGLALRHLPFEQNVIFDRTGVKIVQYILCKNRKRAI